MPVNIIIYEDNANLRESLSSLLALAGDYSVMASYADCSGVTEQVREYKPSVILMDIDMPGVNGIEGVTKLRVKYPELPVLMLTGFEDDEKVFNSICAGANGYVL